MALQQNNPTLVNAACRTLSALAACLLSCGVLPSSTLRADDPTPQARDNQSTKPQPADGSIMKVTEVEGISEYQLENGVRILLFPDASKEVVTVNMTVFVGSRHEGYGEAGMAHLLEHMLFKGTPSNPDIPKALKDRGAGRSMNGTTWMDRTNYYETLPATGDNLEFAIQLEADRLVNSKILGEDLASEMTVVRNEFESGENSPFRVLMQRVQAAAYEWHNYGQTTIGNRSDIERVPVVKLRQFYRKFYRPDNVMVIVAGKFEEKLWDICRNTLEPFQTPTFHWTTPTPPNQHRMVNGQLWYGVWVRPSWSAMRITFLRAATLIMPQQKLWLPF